jgi:hypothetical protein
MLGVPFATGIRQVGLVANEIEYFQRWLHSFCFQVCFKFGRLN